MPEYWRNLLKGASELNLFPSDFSFADMMDDREAMEDDWAQVGNDLWHALENAMVWLNESQRRRLLQYLRQERSSADRQMTITPEDRQLNLFEDHTESALNSLDHRRSGRQSRLEHFLQKLQGIQHSDAQL